MKSLVSLTAGAIAVALVSSADGAMIAGWSITTAFPTGTGNVPTGNTYSVGAADQGDQTAGSELRSYHALAAATYTSPAGNGSQYAFSSNNWSIRSFCNLINLVCNTEFCNTTWPIKLIFKCHLELHLRAKCVNFIEIIGMDLLQF
jgi:hypothetical protein